MKFALLVATLASVFVSTSFATTRARFQGVFEKTIVMTTSKIDPQHLSDAISGNFVINYDAGTVSLHLYSRGMTKCPPRAMCKRMISAPKMMDVTLPITNVTSDGCGTLIVTAAKDDRPADGSFQQIKIEDQSQLPTRCMNRSVQEYRATYTTQSATSNNPVVSKMYITSAE